MTQSKKWKQAADIAQLHSQVVMIWMANTADLKLAWENVPKIQNIKAAAQAFHIAVLEGGQINTAIQILSKLEEEELKREKEMTDIGFRNWVEASLEGGAGPARKWTNKENTNHSITTYSQEAHAAAASGEQLCG